MNRRRNQHQSQNTFLQDNPEYHIKYYELRKEARVWNNTGQYWLGQEANRRAASLLNGDVDGYNAVKHSHELCYPHVVEEMILSRVR
jgi:hypothetical protein